MTDPIRTSDGRVLVAATEDGEFCYRLATPEDVRAACGCEVSGAERDGYMMQISKLQASLLRSEAAVGEQRDALDRHFLRDAEHLSIIAELSGMVERLQVRSAKLEYMLDYNEREVDGPGGLGDQLVEATAALTEAQADIALLQGQLAEHSRLLQRAHRTLRRLGERRRETRDDLRHMTELRQRGCECSDDEACAFARERDAALDEVERLRAVTRVQAEHIANQRAKCRRYDDACRAIFTDDPADDGKAGELADHINGLRAEVERLRDGYMLLPEDLGVQLLLDEVVRLRRVADAAQKLDDARALGPPFVDDAWDKLGAALDQCPAPPEFVNDRVQTCSGDCGRTMHRFQPSPDAGPFWRCFECGEPNSHSPPTMGLGGPPAIGLAPPEPEPDKRCATCRRCGTVPTIVGCLCHPRPPELDWTAKGGE